MENIIKHAFVLCSEGLIEPLHLPAYLLKQGTPASVAAPDGAAASLHSSIEGEQRRIILETLKNCDYNRSETARKLGMDKSTLCRKVKKLSIELPQADGRSRASCTPPEPDCRYFATPRHGARHSVSHRCNYPFLRATTEITCICSI